MSKKLNLGMMINTGGEITMALLKGVPEKSMKDFDAGKKLYKNLTELEWVNVNGLIDYIEQSKSPDGDYPDADCVIQELNKLRKVHKNHQSRIKGKE